MRASKIASTAALVGAVAWLVKVLLVWASGGENSDGGVVAVCFFLGIAALAVALVAAGYATVTDAPPWLRVVVPVAVLALGWIIFGSIDSAAKGVYDGDGWLRDELGLLICAAIALVAGAIGWLRGWNRQVEPRVTGKRRATR